MVCPRKKSVPGTEGGGAPYIGPPVTLPQVTPQQLEVQFLRLKRPVVIRGGCANFATRKSYAKRSFVKRPVQSKFRVPLFAACTLNATGQYRVTLSLR